MIFFLIEMLSECAKLFNKFPVHAIELDEDIWKRKNELFSSSRVSDEHTQKLIQEMICRA